MFENSCDFLFCFHFVWFPLSLLGPRRERRKGGRSRNVKDKDWILRKKDRARRQGKAVALDSKYTARKRRPAF